MNNIKNNLQPFVLRFKRYFGITPKTYAFYRRLGCLPVLSSSVVVHNTDDRRDFVSFVNAFNRLTASDSCVKFLFTFTNYLDIDGSVFSFYHVFPSSSSLTNVLDLECWFLVLDKVFNYEV